MEKTSYKGIDGAKKMGFDRVMAKSSFIEKNFNFEIDFRYEDQEGLIDKIASLTLNRRF